MNTEQTINIKQSKPTGLVVTSWVLIVLICLFSLIPGIGFFSWLVAIPILLVTFICGIIAISKGAAVNGILILLVSLIGAPIFLFVAPIITTSGVVVVAAAAAAEELEKERQVKLTELETATPSSLRYEGELAEIFTLGSNYTDVQRQNKEKELKGQVIEWEFVVYEVEKNNGYYDITPKEGLLSNKVAVSTVYLYPRSEEESQLIESWKEDAKFTARGYIDNVMFRSLIIAPARLVL